MSIDPIMDLHYRGASARQIADRVGKTRNAVLGHIWRYKKRGAPLAPLPELPPHDVIMAALGGGVARAAKKLGVSEYRLRKAGYTSPRPKRNLSNDPLTRATLMAIDASGISDMRVAEDVGLGITTISGWRRGSKGHKFLLECVMEYLKKNTPGY